MLKKLFKTFVHTFTSRWVCPNCGCEKEYKGEGNMRCPYCNAWMEEED